jgi:protein KRI1
MVAVPVPLPVSQGDFNTCISPVLLLPRPTKSIIITTSPKVPASIISKMKAIALWEDNDDHDDDDDEDQEDHRHEISVNSKFAQEFERKKQRQELQQFKDDNLLLDGDHDESSTSSSEDEDGDLLMTTAMDVQVFRTIQALKRKDATIYDPNVRFFPSSSDNEDDDDEDEDDDDSEDDVNPTKAKKKRFKDVIREQILQDVEKMDQEQEQKQRKRRAKEGSDDDDDEEEEDGAKGKRSSFSTADRLAYDEEQRQLRKAFLQSHHKSEDDDSDEKGHDDKEEEEDWLVIKEKHHPSSQDEELYVKELDNLEQIVRSSSKRNHNKNSAATGTLKQASPLVDPRGEVEDGEQFLLEFLKKKKWKDITPTTHHDGDDDEEEEADEKKVDDNMNEDDNDDSSLEQLEKTEAFESEYNFRFEQTTEASSGAALSLQSYARGNNNNTSITAGLLRRPDDTRRERRVARLQRKAEERQAKEEQLRRLKNAKRQELQEKLNQIQSILGPTSAKSTSSSKSSKPVMDEATLMKLLEGDFDPDQFEQVMKETYGDDFYEQPEEEWKSDADVKKALQAAAIDEDEKQIAAAVLGDDEDDEYEYGEESEDEYGVEDEEEEEAFLQDKKNRSTEETQIEKKFKAKMLDELYKLDYEDIVAGIPTRFKYRQVEPNNYGLSTQEILMARDSTLQQVVSLKQMAPYREGEYTVNSKKRRRFRETIQHEVVEQDVQVDDGRGEAQTQGSRLEDETTDPAKKKRRRQKKNQKQNEDEPLEAVSEGGDQANGGSSKHGDLVAEDGKKEEGGPAKTKRRRRKKKSSLNTESDNKEQTTPKSEEILENTKEPLVKPMKNVVSDAAPPTSPAKSTEATQLSEQKDVKEDPNHQLTKKKKNKKKKLSVKGVSATRFASYGLALAMLVMLSSWDQVPTARAWLSPSIAPLHQIGCKQPHRSLTVRFMEQLDPINMKLREIQGELKDLGVSFADCFDRESLTKRLMEARQGLFPEPIKSQTATATASRESSSPSDVSNDTPATSIAFDRSAVVQELRSRSVKELREECAQRRIRWANFIEKEDLVHALVEARAAASSFSASGLIVPGQVADLTDEELTMELESASSKHINTPLLLDVYATWCGPCQIMAPQLVTAAAELGTDVRVAKLDSDLHPLWPHKLKVGALPTVIVFDAQGRELERVEGALMKDGLVQLARRHTKD